MSDITPELVNLLQVYFNLNLARAKCAGFIILGLIKLGTVNLAKLALCISGDASQDSKYRRVQRLFSEVSLSEHSLARFIINKLGENTKFALIMDRTNWKFGKININILFLSISYSSFAIPLFWMFLPKKGNSNTAERIILISKYIKFFGSESIEFLAADREFIGGEWFKYLHENNIKIRIRIKEDAVISKRRGGKSPARNFCRSLKIGESMSLDGQRVVYGTLCYVTVARLADEYLIIVSLDNPGVVKVMEDYKRRWGIETMFKCLKSSGFNFEDTHLTEHSKLNMLIGLMTISFLWSCLAGEYRSEEKEIKTKTHKRKQYTIFRYGLDLLRAIFLNLSEQFKKAGEVIALLRNPPTSPPAPSPEDLRHSQHNDLYT